MRKAQATAQAQAAPFTVIFALFFIVPLVFIVVVSFWDYTEYRLIPTATLRNYSDLFDGCMTQLPHLCVTLKTYVITIRIALVTWLLTLVAGFAVAYFLAFHVRSAAIQMALFLLCTVPFWTSNVIRMISWIPLLGRNGVINTALIDAGMIHKPIEWLLYSEFSVVLAFVHLYTLFMIVPIFNSMIRIDRSLLEASADAGASGWSTLVHVVIPLCKPGIVIGSIFVLTLVMGDFVTIGVMGGEQIASVGKIIQVEMSYLQFPAAAANAVLLLIVVLMMVYALTRIVDIRREL